MAGATRRDPEEAPRLVVGNQIASDDRRLSQAKRSL